MRLRYLPVLLLVLAAVAVIAGKRLLYPNLSTRAASLSSPPSQSYLVILGVGDKVANNWDGSITATGATILGLQGWRFAGTDSITDRKSTRLNSSHQIISYAVFCLKKKKHYEDASDDHTVCDAVASFLN